MSLSPILTIDPVAAGSIPEIGANPTSAEIDRFRKSGVGVVRGLIPASEIDEIRAAYSAATAAGPVEGVSETRKGVSDPDDPLVRYPRMLQPHRHPELEIGTIALRYLLDPRIGEVIRAVTFEEPLAAQSMFYFKPPGARGQGLHQDNNPLAVKPGTCIAAWIAVDRCDAENGALSVVPGSGPLELLCDVEKEDRADIFFNSGSILLPDQVKPVTAEMDPGDVLFFNGQVIHGSYPNTSAERWRRALIFHYVPSSCEQVAGFYHPLLGFDGREVKRAVSPTGGLCGEFHHRPDASMSMTMM